MCSFASIRASMSQVSSRVISVLAWHCSREYRGERSRLLGASSHTNPSLPTLDPAVHDCLPLHGLSIALAFPSLLLLPSVYLRPPLTLRDYSEFSSVFLAHRSSPFLASFFSLPFSISTYLSLSLSRQLLIPSSAQVSFVHFYLRNTLSQSHFLSRYLSYRLLHVNFTSSNVFSTSPKF